MDREFPGAKPLRTTGQHTTLATPLLRQGVPIGAILIRRLEVRPFSDKQIKLLKTSPIKLSSPSRTFGCLRNSKLVTAILPKPSISKRPQAKSSK